jgi:hypothetical protein
MHKAKGHKIMTNPAIKGRAWGLLVVMVLVGSTVFGQLRSDLMAPPQVTSIAASTQSKPLGSVGSWMNLIPMTMSHSYSASFGTFGGQTMNLNAYTNRTQFQFTDRFTGEMSLSFLHSPFGMSPFATSQQGNGLNGQFQVDYARLNYQISDKAMISVEFSQRPYGAYGPYGNSFGMSPYGYGAASAFDRRPSSQRALGPWW